MSTVLVTGATGTLGTLLVRRLQAAGYDVHALSRDASVPTGSATGMETSGAGTYRRVAGDLTEPGTLEVAVEGVDVVVHCASDPRNAEEVDVRGSGHLLESLSRHNRDAHLLYVSIVGVDRIPWSFYRAKWRTEQLVEESVVPWTIQRATQFHAFLAGLLGQLAKSPLLPLPGKVRFQPVDPDEVAGRIVELVRNGSAGRVPDFGGPEIHDARDLARSWLRATGRRRAVVPVPLPGDLGAAFRDGANLCPEHTDGQVTWQSYLDRLSPR
jgi:uncharacterized protein YbjT (DUF2867 family)